MTSKKARRMRFGTWCRKDPEDTTPIIYTFRMKEADGQERTERFTSEDSQSYAMLSRLRESWVESIKRVKNDSGDVWNVVLYED